MIRIQSTLFTNLNTGVKSRGYLIWDNLTSTYIISNKEYNGTETPLDHFKECLELADDDKANVFWAMLDEAEEDEAGLIVDGTLLSWEQLKKVL